MQRLATHRTRAPMEIKKRSWTELCWESSPLSPSVRRQFRLMCIMMHYKLLERRPSYKIHTRERSSNLRVQRHYNRINIIIVLGHLFFPAHWITRQPSIPPPHHSAQQLKTMTTTPVGWTEYEWTDLGQRTLNSRKMMIIFHHWRSTPVVTHSTSLLLLYCTFTAIGWRWVGGWWLEVWSIGNQRTRASAPVDEWWWLLSRNYVTRAKTEFVN